MTILRMRVIKGRPMGYFIGQQETSYRGQGGWHRDCPRDRGCALSPSCLNCPFDHCRYDELDSKEGRTP